MCTLNLFESCCYLQNTYLTIPVYASIVCIIHLFMILFIGTKIVGAKSIEEMVKKLKKPRRVMMLVKAGPAVDAFIEQVLPYVEKGDIIIDGGNSEYLDTQVSEYIILNYKYKK